MPSLYFVPEASHGVFAPVAAQHAARDGRPPARRRGLPHCRRYDTLFFVKVWYSVHLLHSGLVHGEDAAFMLNYRRLFEVAFFHAAETPGVKACTARATSLLPSSPSSFTPFLASAPAKKIQQALLE